jgi:hypothetical protein
MFSESNIRLGRLVKESTTGAIYRIKVVTSNEVSLDLVKQGKGSIGEASLTVNKEVLKEDFERVDQTDF